MRKMKRGLTPNLYHDNSNDELLQTLLRVREGENSILWMPDSDRALAPICEIALERMYYQGMNRADLRHRHGPRLGSPPRIIAARDVKPRKLIQQIKQNKNSSGLTVIADVDESDSRLVDDLVKLAKESSIMRWRVLLLITSENYQPPLPIAKISTSLTLEKIRSVSGYGWEVLFHTCDRLWDEHGRHLLH